MIFSTSSVDWLWVRSCLWQYIRWSLSESMWSFFWSSIQILMLFVDICSFPVLVCHEWVEFLEPESMYSIMAWCFPIWYFLVLFWVNRCISPLSDLLPVLRIHLLCYLFIRLFCNVGCHILLQKVFGFTCIWWLICFPIISHHSLVEFPFVILESPVLSVFYPFSISLNLPSFASTFWFISSSCYFSNVSFSFLSLHVPAFFSLFYHFNLFS